MFYKIGVLKNFAKFTVKRLCRGFFVIYRLNKNIFNKKERDSGTDVFQ